MGYATHLRSIRKLASSSIRNYLSAVRSFCVDIGASTLSFYDPTLVRLLEGITRLQRANDPARKRVRLPITVSLLNRMIPKFPTSKAGIMLRAACTTGVYGLLRAGEMTVKSSRHNLLTRADITWSPDGAEIHLKRSKTDYLRAGVTIKLFANGSLHCPIKLLRQAWEAAVDKAPSAALFQDGRGRPLKYVNLLKSIKGAIKALRLPLQHYSCHSLRAGGATTLALMGYPDSLIKTLGRWRSLAYQRYIKLDPHSFRDVSGDMAKQGAICEPFGGLPGYSASCASVENVDVSFRIS
jgi:integrase